MTLSEQLCLLPECAYQARPALHESPIAAGSASNIALIASTVVGYGVMFEISPYALHHIHVGGVGREVVDEDLVAPGPYMRPYGLGAVGLLAIPDD